MPNIRTFENEQTLRPDDSAAQAAARSGQAAGQAMSSIGQSLDKGITSLGDAYVKVKTQQDISHGMAVGAQLSSANTTNWQQTIANADPNDHTTGQKWMAETLEPQLDQFVQGFNTQEGRDWATQYTATVRQHFTEKTMADQAIQAGQAAVQNIHDTVSNLSTMALQDPTSLNMSLGLLDHTIDAMAGANPNLTESQIASVRGELREKGREEIAKGALIGSARANPDAAMQSIQDGKYNGILDATTQNQMFGFAEDLKRSRARDDRAAQAQTLAQQKQAVDGRLSALTAQMFAPDGSIKPIPDLQSNLVTLSAMPGADASAIRALGDANAAAVKAQIEGTYQRTNNATWVDLSGRIGLPAGAPNALSQSQVDRAYADGKLSNPDYAFLRKAADVQADPAQRQALAQIDEGLKRMKPLIDKSTMYSVNQTTSDQYNTFYYDTMQKYQTMVSSGRSPAEAAKILLDPRSPEGARAAIPTYQIGNKAGLQSLTKSVGQGGGITPLNPNAPSGYGAGGRKAGESAADYLKRTGG